MPVNKKYAFIALTIILILVLIFIYTASKSATTTVPNNTVPNTTVPNNTVPNNTNNNTVPNNTVPNNTNNNTVPNNTVPNNTTVGNNTEQNTVPNNAVPVIISPAKVYADRISLCDDGTVYTILSGKLFSNGNLIALSKPVIDVAGVNANNFYWVAADNLIYFNNFTQLDGGATRISVRGGQIWVIGLNNDIYRSFPLPIFWSKTNGLLVNICSVSLLQAVGVNSNGDAFKTMDGGNSWSLLESGVKEIVTNGHDTVTLSSTGLVNVNNKARSGTYKSLSISATQWAAIDSNNVITINNF